MTNEQIKDIKLALECCSDEIDGCPNCPYARKNAKDGIAHCRQMYLDIMQLLDDYEQRIAQLELEIEQIREKVLTEFAEKLKVNMSKRIKDNIGLKYSQSTIQHFHDKAQRALDVTLHEFLNSLNNKKSRR